MRFASGEVGWPAVDVSGRKSLGFRLALWPSMAHSDSLSTAEPPALPRHVVAIGADQLAADVDDAASAIAERAQGNNRHAVGTGGKLPHGCRRAQVFKFQALLADGRLQAVAIDDGELAFAEIESLRSSSSAQ